MPEKKLLPYLPKFTPQQINLIKVALAVYLDLPPEGVWLGRIGLSSPQVLKRALVDAVGKGLLTFGEANEIASIIGVSLYNRPPLRMTGKNRIMIRPEE
jgi:hypothetical protein